MIDMKVSTPLKGFREEAKIIQFDMAVNAGIRPNTYTRIERGANVSYTTAMAILKTLNTFRVNCGLSPVERVEDLGLKIV